jgi:DnaJ-class molecular chaperone
MARLNCDPIEGMAKIAAGDVPCGTCHGKGKTKYQAAKGEAKLLERTCESCYGSGKEKISPELKGRMYEQLAKYKHPQLKAIEHSGEIATGMAEQILAARKARGV